MRARSRRPVPLLLTDGNRSPAFLRAIVTVLARLLGTDRVERRTLAGAGHVPQLTHPERYVAAVRGLLAADR